MSLYNGPARGGNRGGKDQFNWDSVKNDKDREFYLGHSVKASTGRWQKNKDILWYTRQKGVDEAQQRADELVAIKAREEDLMAEAMGLKPKSRPVAKPKLDATDMELLMRKARGEDDEEAAEPDGKAVDHMPGLGFHAGDMLVANAGGSEHEVLAGTGTQQPGAAAGQAARGGNSAAGQPLRLSSEQQNQLAEAEKRAAKATRKAEKEARRVAKTARKEEKKSAKRDRHEGHKARGSSPGQQMDNRSSPKRRADQPSSDGHHSKRHKRSQEQ